MLRAHLLLLSCALLAPALLAGELVIPDAFESGHCHFPLIEPQAVTDAATAGTYLSVSETRAAIVVTTSIVEKDPHVDVYALVAGTWVFEQRITRPDDNNDIHWGRALHVSDDQLLVGSPRHGVFGSHAGAVYIYDRTPGGWVPGGVLGSTQPEEWSFFGGWIDRDGPYTVIGSPRWHVNGPPSSVELFDGDFELVERIVTPDVTGWGYGESGALSGMTLLVGEARSDAAGEEAGAVHRYAITGFGVVYRETLTAHDAQPEAAFGRSIDMQGDVAVIGARRQDVTGSESGQAYVYQLDEDDILLGTDALTFVEHLAPAELLAEDRFGSRVAIDGERIAVSATGRQTGRGTLYTFTRSPFQDLHFDEDSRLEVAGAADYDFLGSGLALRRHHVLAGVPGYGDHGGFYTFALGAEGIPGGPCPTDHMGVDVVFGQAKPGQLGAPVLDPHSPPSLGEMSRFYVRNLLPGSPGFLLLGLAATDVPFDQGHLYVADPIFVNLPPVPPWGSLLIAYEIPADPVFSGLQLVHQLLFLDPVAPGPHGTAQTPGLLRTFGH